MATGDVFLFDSYRWKLMLIARACALTMVRIQTTKRHLTEALSWAASATRDTKVSIATSVRCFYDVS